MYLQIMDGIKALVISQEWPSGHALPSIRELASALKVSVITVKRAYQELERDGLIVTRHGMGSFIASATETVSEQKRVELQDHLNQAIALAKLIKMEDDVLCEQLRSLLAARDKTGDTHHDG